ncbi:MAG TPA: 4Fe-4S dicluster domain-containing protein [Actinomycetota bacterium]|nr:4Fe-4S dicluster domain-containing protein [Actinomycetota bacterium]
MSDAPVRDAGEHFDIAVLDAEDMQRAKGAKKYLGFIPELCIVCGACVDHCPWHCLFMVDSSAVEGEASALIVDDAIKTDKPRVIFWVDDVECTRCNICVERCPTDAITMDKIVKPKADSRNRHLGTT